MGTDQGCLERRRGTQAAQLVREQRTTAVEFETQDPLVGRSSFGQTLHGGEQKAKSGRPGFL
jgi:hypothetical protein